MPTVQRIKKKDSSAKSKGDDFYQSSTWKAIRAAHYSRDAHQVLCYYCSLSGMVRIGNTVDHYRPRRLYPELQYDLNNLRSACPFCDSKKRLFEKTIATREQFEKEIDNFIQTTFKKPC